MDKLRVKDVLEAIVIDRDASGEITDAKFFGATTESSISQDAPVEKLRAGIGSKVQALSYGDKEVTFSITNLFKNSSVMAMRMGKALASGKQDIVTAIPVTLGVAGAIPTEKLNGATDYKVLDLHNKELTVATDKVTDGKEGQEVIVIVSKEVTGQVVALGSNDFPQPKEVHLHTIAYEPKSETVIADIYWIFKRAVPSGTFEESLGMGNNNETIEFDTLPDAEGNHGYYIEVPRTQA